MKLIVEIVINGTPLDSYEIDVETRDGVTPVLEVQIDYVPAESKGTSPQ